MCSEVDDGLGCSTYFLRLPLALREIQIMKASLDYRLLPLERVWTELVLPDLDLIAASTMQEYRHCLSLFTRLSTYNDGGHLRHNPPVGLISREIVRGFRDKLLSTPYRSGKGSRKRSTATVNRILRDLHVVLSPLWPADRVNPGGLGLTGLFKWPRSLDHQKQLPFVFSGKDLDSLYLHAGACVQTPGCRTTGLNLTRLWRASFTLALNCGPRTWDLFGLEWKDIRLDETGPYRFGCVIFNAKKTGKLHRIPLNQCAQRHLLDLSKRRIGDDSPRVFPGFAKGRAFYLTWRRICEAANVSGTFESLRKTSVTCHNNIVWNAGFWLSGHIQTGVFGHYDNPSERIFEAVYKLENPPEFVKGANALVV